ncbi:MAG: hypothetical protein WCA22_10015 [Candidatus Binatus sp.]
MKIRDAPRYQSRLTPAERVQVFDSSKWKPASADELAAWTGNREPSADDVLVIGIPRHLLKRWWSLAESDHITKGFEGYGREVAEYFEYKKWRWPVLALLEVVAAGGKGDRALVPSNPMRFGNGVGTLFACINLGEENAAIAIDAGSGRIRVILEPGEGVMLPESGIRWNRSALGGSDVAITMLIGELSTE